MAATGQEAVTLEQLKRLKDSSSGGGGGGMTAETIFSSPQGANSGTCTGSKQPEEYDFLLIVGEVYNYPSTALVKTSGEHAAFTGDLTNFYPSGNTYLSTAQIQFQNSSFSTNYVYLVQINSDNVVSAGVVGNQYCKVNTIWGIDM